MANTTFNPYKDLLDVYNAKVSYGNATTDAERLKQQQIAEKARANLSANGFSDVAKQVSAEGADAQQTKKVLDSWAKYNKTSTRPYLYSLGESRGMSQSDIDKLIGWDAQTGEVSFGGVKIGRPDALVDGASYWSDTSVLDNAFNDYVQRSNHTIDSGVDNPAYNTSMQGASNKNNILAGYIDSDRKDVQGKYDDIYKYANSDVTKTDEYKSTYNNLMAKYDLSALQGRNNAVASGGASNGGNIDSYAAANAMRQQAALTAQGQVIAHQAGLDAYNARVSNVANILNQLGVYNSGTYDAMNQSIANDANLAQQYFDNSETAKNNEVARLKEEAAVTGVAPLAWTIKNDSIYNEFLNEDGSFKSEKENVDIQALINSAKASGDTETAQKLAAVRARKILSNYNEFGQYANTGDIGSLSALTEAAKQFRMTDATNKEKIAADERVADAANKTTIYGINADYDKTIKGYSSNERINAANNATDIQINSANNASNEKINAANNATDIQINSANNASNERMNTANNASDEKIALTKSTSGGLDLLGGDVVDEADDIQASLDKVYKNSSKTVQKYIRNVLEPEMQNTQMTEIALRNHLINNAKAYDLEVADIKAICQALGVDTKWVDNYKNAGLLGWGSGVVEKK